ncbi:zinc-RING finger domain [Fragilaria crotonensis]|nr:zinc-RING finger domain [Fragilaria crotonensis]
MIDPVPPPEVIDPWAADFDTAAAAWREREQRQRSVRLLMMFLLMLLLMDGEEQSTRRRNDPNNPLRKRKNSKKHSILDVDVFEARREQEDRLIKLTRTHPRFMRLLALNDDINHETMIRKWADQQQELEQTASTDAPKKAVDPDEDKKGVEDDAALVRYLSTIELEGPLKRRAAEIDERVGVFLLPHGTQIKAHNNSALRDEQAISEAASVLRARARTPTSWLSGVGQPELNEMLAKAEEDTAPPAQVTLTKEHGRAAFQFYSRSIPAMKELSLVDGFVKLYDSNTVGYSTRRDMLLRVRGIRDNVLDLYPYDALDDDDSGNWELMQSTEFGLPTFSQYDSSGWLFDVINWFWNPPSERPFKVNRRLSEVIDIQTDVGIEIPSESTLPDMSSLADADADPNPSFDRGNLTLDGRMLQTTSNIATMTVAADDPFAVEEKSKIVIPFPYVPDDKLESIRKTKTAAGRRMPAREQMLEANAGRCEFEINLNVHEVEWTLGQWKSLISRSVFDSRLVDPKLHQRELEDADIDDEEDGGSNRGSHMKTKHAESSSNPRSEREKVANKPVQAVAMILSGTIHSPNCDFSSALNATAIRTDWESTTGKAINYSFYMMLTCLAQIVVLLRQLLHTQHQSSVARVSLVCIGWQAVLDALLCLTHIYLSLAMQPLFTAFASVAFFKLLIFCVIEMKYMAIIVQARNNANGGMTTADFLRRQIAMLHLRFYVALVGAFLAFFYAGQQYRTIYMLALYSFWVPQIIQNVITEAKHPLHTYFIYGMSISRCVVPIYIFAVKDNFLKEVYPDSPTDYFMVELLVIWIGLQTAILIAQGKYGARFMIPARFLPPKFNYHRKVPPSMIPEDAEQNSGKDRTPSLGPLTTETDTCKTTGTRNRLKGNRSKPEPLTTTMTTEAIAPPPSNTLDCVICCNAINHHNRKGYMLAPCDHIFHKDCLIQWMDVKMECPICRTELPAI